MSSIITKATSEPITLQEAKRQLNLEHDDDDLLVSRLISASRTYAESVTGCSIARVQRRLYLNAFDEAYLPFGPVSSISQVQYKDTNNVTQTLSTSVYELNSAEDQLILSYNQEWPSTLDHVNSVWVDYWAGHFDSTTSPYSYSMPEDLKAVCLLVLGDLYLNRESQTDIQLYENKCAEMMLGPYRRYAL